MRTKFPFLYSIFNKIRRDFYLVILRLLRGADEPKEVFNFYFERNLFGDPDSLSGTGSSLAATASIRSALPPLLATLNMKVVLDVPCGDFNWAKEIDWKPFHYIGADIVSDLVDRNRALYASDGVEFLTAPSGRSHRPARHAQTLSLAEVGDAGGASIRSQSRIFGG